MVWRKADNWTTFTDGYRTWINGPHGLPPALRDVEHNDFAELGLPFCES